MESLFNEMLPDVMTAFRGSFAPVYYLILVGWGIIAKKLNLDKKLSERFNITIKLDYLLLLSGVILGLTLVWFEPTFKFSNVDTLSMASRANALVITYMVAVLSYQYVLNIIFKKLNLNTRKPQ